MSRYLGASPGMLVAVDMPPGPGWLDVIAELWEAGAAILPLDPRLSERERRMIVDLARPASMVTVDDEVLFADTDPAEPDRVGLVIATSGTAGRLKLAELSRPAVAAAVGLSLTALGPACGSAALEPSDPWVGCLSPAHIGGMLVLMRHVLFGTPVTVFDHLGLDLRDPMTGVPAGSHVALVPTLLRRALEAGTDLSRLGIVLVGGAAIDPALARRAAERGLRVVSTYGLTETSGGVAYDGRMFDGTHVRIDRNGAIQLKGPTIMEGYRHDPAATAAAFTIDGWVRTGDMGGLETDGRLRVDGRSDDAIRTGAETVWPQEVEDALVGHPKVSEVAVAGRPHEEWGQQVVAFVVPVSRDDPPGLDELRQHGAERLAPSKLPRAVVQMVELPRTSSGKVRRGALPR